MLGNTITGGILMQIKVMEPMPFDQSIEPAIEFPIMLTYNNLEVPIGIEGVLMAEDNKILSSLQDLSTTSISGSIGNLGALGTIHDSNQLQVNEHKISLVSVLNIKAIDHINNLRIKNIRGDVKLKLILKVKILQSKAAISSLHLKDSADFGPPLTQSLRGESIVSYNYVREYSPGRNNMWLISGDSSPVFLSLSYLQHELLTTIYSGSWLQDFSPKLGLGKFIVAELPIPTSKAIKGEFSERLNEAIEALRKMESKIQEGEWTEAIEKSRPVAELVKEEDMIKSILSKHGYQDDAANSLFSAVKNLFDYTSKFHHKLERDKKTLLTETQAEKEDAYLAYSMSVALVNLLTQKFNKPELR
jgi:hypothetical protein